MAPPSTFGEAQMALRKTTITVGVLLAVGLGTADRAAAGSHCGRMAGYHGQPHGDMMMQPGGCRYGADVVGLDSATTVQPGTLMIDTTDGVKVDGASVVKTDIAASNGVIHVIDTVLTPK
jgi:hypothetical protein